MTDQGPPDKDKDSAGGRDQPITYQQVDRLLARFEEFVKNVSPDRAERPPLTSEQYAVIARYDRLADALAGPVDGYELMEKPKASARITFLPIAGAEPGDEATVHFTEPIDDLSEVRIGEVPVDRPQQYPGERKVKFRVPTKATSAPIVAIFKDHRMVLSSAVFVVRPVERVLSVHPPVPGPGENVVVRLPTWMSAVDKVWLDENQLVFNPTKDGLEFRVPPDMRSGQVPLAITFDRNAPVCIPLRIAETL